MNSGNSSPVLSNQQSCHEHLDSTVRKHLASPSRRPPAHHTRDAFEAIRPRVESDARPLVLDSYCGTGMSTSLLAERFQDSLVIGIDKSAHRLGRHQPTGRDNYLLVHADCGDFWRLALAAGWRPARHFLLYPNPWPKSAQLKRRVHGSADFPALLELGGDMELRSNWRVYVEEFAAALGIGGQSATAERFTPTQPLTLFERKYLQSGHGLWRCRCMVVHNSAQARAR